MGYLLAYLVVGFATAGVILNDTAKKAEEIAVSDAVLALLVFSLWPIFLPAIAYIVVRENWHVILWKKKVKK